MAPCRLMRPIDVIRQVYAAPQTGDLPISEALTDTGTNIFHTPVLSWGGTFQSLDGYRQLVAYVFRRFDSAAVVERTVEAGDRVAVVGHTAGTVRANSHASGVSLVHLYTAREGRVAEATILTDTPAMIAMLEPTHA